MLTQQREFSFERESRSSARLQHLLQRMSSTLTRLIYVFVQIAFNVFVQIPNVFYLSRLKMYLLTETRERLQ